MAIIAIDFDGTIVEHKYPKIGKPIMGALETMKKLQKKGHQLILYTMRSNLTLKEAVDYLEENGIELWGVNENPTQHTWTQSPKIYAQIYIDDAALGCPLVRSFTKGERPYVDWFEVELQLKKLDIL